MKISQSRLYILTLCGLCFSGSTFAISPDYLDQITCKNWRVQLKDPMAFPSFVGTNSFQKEFKQTKSSDEDEGDYYSDIFKPRLPQKIFGSQILSVTSDAGYGGEWVSAGFSVDLKGDFQKNLQQVKSHLKISQWQTSIEQYEDENGRNIKHKVYYAIQPYLKAKQARYVKIHQDTQNNMITFGCRAIEGDIPMFIRNMSGNWDY